MKKNNFIFSFILCFISSALLISCADSPASLVGVYSIEEHGQLNELIRIEKQGEKYFMAEKQNGNWRSPLEITPVNQSKSGKNDQSNDNGWFYRSW